MSRDTKRLEKQVSNSPTSDVDEERIEELIEIENELQTKYEKAKRTETGTLTKLSTKASELAENSITTPVSGTVTDIERIRSSVRNDRLRLEVRIGDETHNFTLGWPEDAADVKDSELTKLLNYVGVDVDRLANLRGEEVPVLEDGRGRYELAVPESNLAISRALQRIGMIAFHYRLLHYTNSLGGDKVRPTLRGVYVFPILGMMAGFIIQTGAATVGVEALSIAGWGIIMANLLLIASFSILVVLALLLFVSIYFIENIWPF